MDTFENIVICKKTCNYKSIYFYEGKQYKFILDEYDPKMANNKSTTDGGVIIDGLPFKYQFVYVISSEPNSFAPKGLRFHLDKINRIDRGFIKCFYDYFCDLTDIRTLKIKQLQGG